MKGILFSGSTYFTAPSAISCLGMPKTTLLSSFCAMVMPPAWKMACMPRAPSLPIPVRWRLPKADAEIRHRQKVPAVIYHA
jgi:hypothetical protein